MLLIINFRYKLRRFLYPPEKKSSKAFNQKKKKCAAKNVYFSLLLFIFSRKINSIKNNDTKKSVHVSRRIFAYVVGWQEALKYYRTLIFQQWLYSGLLPNGSQATSSSLLKNERWRCGVWANCLAISRFHFQFTTANEISAVEGDSVRHQAADAAVAC